MDLTDSITPKSEQLNAEDMLSGPRTVTIEKISKGSAEQPVNIHLVEFPGRPFRPCKSVRRVLVAAWGADAAQYVGRRMVIFNDPTVKWAGQDVGGLRIKALSHIDKRLTLALTVTRGQRKPVVIEPLPAGLPLINDAQVQELSTAIETAADRAALDAITAQLKAFDLAQHRGRLVQLWKDRANALSDEEQAASEDSGQADDGGMILPTEGE
ncbi:hypothetical protein IU449_26690 [Nocardia higoensis]|uniref:DUF1905 domain-containing protein n=1 Tax=Nocardia higoensis TaxID=228599 RepID=A0ABS0DHZ7_9NOCA|nr:hypothetical protein [Nocardia higoensis]MBF6358087.1 hypothetical protein [Nocardia higoensis]